MQLNLAGVVSYQTEKYFRIEQDCQACQAGQGTEYYDEQSNMMKPDKSVVPVLTIAPRLDKH